MRMTSYLSLQGVSVSAFSPLAVSALASPGSFSASNICDTSATFPRSHSAHNPFPAYRSQRYRLGSHVSAAIPVTSSDSNLAYPSKTPSEPYSQPAKLHTESRVREGERAYDDEFTDSHSDHHNDDDNHSITNNNNDTKRFSSNDSTDNYDTYMKTSDFSHPVNRQSTPTLVQRFRSTILFFFLSNFHPFSLSHAKSARYVSACVFVRTWVHV